jgi:putative transposase
MDKISYCRHRFPGIVIQQAIWLYFRFALSYRDVEDMLSERGTDVTYETVRRWVLKFGTIIARRRYPGNLSHQNASVDRASVIEVMTIF